VTRAVDLPRLCNLLETLGAKDFQKSGGILVDSLCLAMSKIQLQVSWALRDIRTESLIVQYRQETVVPRSRRVSAGSADLSSTWGHHLSCSLATSVPTCKARHLRLGGGIYRLRAGVGRMSKLCLIPISITTLLSQKSFKSLVVGQI